LLMICGQFEFIQTLSLAAHNELMVSTVDVRTLIQFKNCFLAIR
jgi:hypothetical protein